MEIQYICGSFFAFSRVFAPLPILFLYNFDKHINKSLYINRNELDSKALTRTGKKKGRSLPEGSGPFFCLCGSMLWNRARYGLYIMICLYVCQNYKEKESEAARKPVKTRKKSRIYIVFPKNCVPLQSILDNGDRFFNN